LYKTLSIGSWLLAISSGVNDDLFPLSCEQKNHSLIKIKPLICYHCFSPYFLEKEGAFKRIFWTGMNPLQMIHFLLMANFQGAVVLWLLMSGTLTEAAV
jgi:hypothetical protein